MVRRHDIRSERGQALVEFALVAPLLIVLLFAIIEFGLVFNQYLTLTDAARSGARQAVVMHSVDAGEAAVRASGSGLDQSKLSVQVAPASQTWASGSDVTVTASYPYTIDILGIVVKSGNLRSTTTERVE